MPRRDYDYVRPLEIRSPIRSADGAGRFGPRVLQAPASYSAFAFSQSSSQPTIYDFINSATASLDMAMYELEDTTAVNDLVALENKGVTVRVVLDGAHKSANQSSHSTRPPR